MKISALLLLAAAVPLSANAWWNEAWTGHRVIGFDTTAAGVEIATPVEKMMVPVRLHSGNFDFLSASADGSDLRFIAEDDITPLPFHLERYDTINELALAWVQVPQLAPGLSSQRVNLYFGNPGAAAAVTQAGYDEATAAVFHFGDAADAAGPRDLSGRGNHSATPVQMEVAGLLAGSARLAGEAIVLPASPSLALTVGGNFGFSAWVRPDALDAPVTLYRQGEVALTIADGQLVLESGGSPVSGGIVTAGAWQHLVVMVGGGEAVLYVNGGRVAAGPATLPAVAAEVRLAEGLTGLLDAVRIDSVVRSPDWVRLAAGAEGGDSRLLTVSEAPVAESGGDHSYLGVLVANLTIDAWVVIVILMVMFAIALVVMVIKGHMVSVTDSDNRAFLDRFRKANEDMLELDQGPAHRHSSLYRLYGAGLREIRKRRAADGSLNLSGAALDAIKASIDADMVRETHRLNAKMVMLTIAISGGPFLGLLGTVVGVMITFAAIAAAGDVNVNAIAPGIAAALLATVAGLAVAIPALFGYNYLASRIKNISADMQIFVDEFVTRVAELHAR